MGFPEHFQGIWHGELEKKWNACPVTLRRGCYSDVCSSHWNLEWCILQGGGAQPKEKLSEQWKRTSNKLNHMWHQFRKSNSNHSQCLQRCAIPGPRAPATRFHWVRATTHWATVLCDKPDKPFRVRLTSPLPSWHKFKSDEIWWGFSQRRPCNKRWIIAEAYNKFSDLSLSEYCLKPSIFWSPWHEPE